MNQQFSVETGNITKPRSSRWHCTTLTNVHLEFVDGILISLPIFNTFVFPLQRVVHTCIQPQETETKIKISRTWPLFICSRSCRLHSARQAVEFFPAQVGHGQDRTNIKWRHRQSTMAVIFNAIFPILCKMQENGLFGNLRVIYDVFCL